MSIAVSKRVRECSSHRGGALLVLLMIADHADDSGLAWPSVKTLAAESRLSERRVWTVLRTLEDSGELSKEPGGGRSRFNRYRITDYFSVKNGARNPEETDTNPEETGTESLKSCSTEPSLEPSLRRSRTVSGARRAPAPSQSGGAQGARLSQKERQLVLSQGYTESDAIEALTAGQNGTWSKWRDRPFNRRFALEDIAEYLTEKARSSKRDDLRVFTQAKAG